MTLIGFSGAPWTLASYMVEGHGSREFATARRLARRDPALFGDLVDLLTRSVTDHLLAQVEAGADAVQLFDSWAGVLPRGGARALVRRSGAARSRGRWPSGTRTCR